METSRPTREQRSAAYAAIKARFDLKHTQRTMLDASDRYRDIVTAAHEGRWHIAEDLLRAEGII